MRHAHLHLHLLHAHAHAHLFYLLPFAPPRAEPLPPPPLPPRPAVRQVLFGRDPRRPARDAVAQPQGLAHRRPEERELLQRRLRRQRARVGRRRPELRREPRQEVGPGFEEVVRGDGQRPAGRVRCVHVGGGSATRPGDF